MSSHVRSCLVIVGTCMLAVSGSAIAQSVPDMCSQPKMTTDAWHWISAPAGMTLMIPPGYVLRGKGSETIRNAADAQFYWSGEHQWVAAGSGPGPSPVSAGVDETGECDAQIAGRRVKISRYDWHAQDSGTSPAEAAAGEHLVIARFYSTATQREAFIAYESNVQSDVPAMRQLFWTASFGGDAPTVAVAAPAPQGARPAAQPAASAPAAEPAVGCTSRPEPNLPTLDAVLDTSQVQMLVANAAPPIPRGFEVMSLEFDGRGGVSGISVAQSDLPAPSQRQLTTLVASNLRQNDAKAPSSFKLRVETLAPGLHYQLLPTAPCTP